MNDTNKSSKMEKKLPTKTDILYQDKYCTVTDKIIKINTYYFPIGTALKVPLEKIQAVFYDKQGNTIFLTKGWGMSLTPVWWACDLKRGLSSKAGHYNVAINTNEAHDKGFTVEKIDEFLTAIKPRLGAHVIIQQGFPYM